MTGTLRLSWEPVGLRSRLENLLGLGGLLLWLGYTRVFWPLHGIHATLPTCPFLTLTGRPCPFCGGTRSFASMWQGDVVGAARYHPLGPALFILTVLAIGVLAAGVIGGRAMRLSLPMALEHRLYIAVAAAFGLSWGLKLLWLGN